MANNSNVNIFRIPDRLEDLEDRENFPNFYYVDCSSKHLSELSNQIIEINNYYKKYGTNFIFQTFDTFYFIIKNFINIDEEIHTDAWNILNSSLASLYTELHEFINEQNQRNLEQRRIMQNKLQMITYALILLSELYEEKGNNLEPQIEVMPQKSKKTPKSKSSKRYHDNKSQMISTILKIYLLRLDRLFDPSHFLNDFINITTRWIYKIIEFHTNTSRLRTSIYFTDMCEIITIALDKYKHNITYCMKIIELLQNKESTVNILSELVAYNINHLSHMFIINDILDQIKSIDINILSRDNSVPRAISSFLSDLGEKCTDDMFKNITDLLEFLEQDSYLMRNATLEIITTIIRKKLKSPSTIKDVHIKNKLLTILVDHIHDVTSYTRIRVLNLWCHLAENTIIPIYRLHSITKKISGRLDDKSCHVRKSAIHFLTLLIKNYPFMSMHRAQITLLKNKILKKAEEHKKQLEKLIDKNKPEDNELFDTIFDDFNDTLNDNSSENENNLQENGKRKNQDESNFINKKQKKELNLIKTWLNLQSSFIDFWQKNGSKLKNKLEQNLIVPDSLPEGIKNGFNYFRELLIEKQFEKALIVLYYLKNQYPNEKVFQEENTSNNREMYIDEEDNIDDDDNRENHISKTNNNDWLFISSITDFSNKTKKTKLPPELTMAKNIFLAPLIELGNVKIDVDELPKDNEKEVTSLLNQSNVHANIEYHVNYIQQCNKLYSRLDHAGNTYDTVNTAIFNIVKLFNSRNVLEIQETINFFTHAYKLELPNAFRGTQKMLKLIFNKETSVRNALLEAFTEMYLNSPLRNIEECTLQNNKLSHLNEIKQLSITIAKLNQGELVCVEIIIKELYKAQKFNQIHLQILWERYAMKYPNLNEEDSRVALIIIGMLASAKPSLIQNESALQNIINISLKTHCHNYRMVADTCEVLLKAFQLPQIERHEKFYKLPQNHQLFEHLDSILVDSIENLNDKYWFRMSGRIIKVIYFLAEKPDMIISKIIEKCYQKIKDLSEIFKKKHNLSKNEIEPAKIREDEENIVVEEMILSHFISMLGDVAINLLIHLDLHLLKELKIRHCIKEIEKKSLNSSGIYPEDNDDEMNEIIGPNNDEPYQDGIFKICDEVLLANKGILAQFTSVVENIVSDYDGCNFSSRLRQCAVLTMAKFMTLSLSYTRKNRGLLADILAKSKNSDIRSNAIIAFGDLFVRFPNEIEHLSGTIFGCLTDSDFTVKINALKVLTRLIMADMVKPKGHISKIAQLITDEDKLISSSAKLFFIEMSHKNNVHIYNFLPDIISNLSGPDGMNECKFKNMIKYLFDLLEKTRNTESLVTKLCHRFTQSSSERSWRDLSFCLSLLNYNDRAIINLINNFPCFSNSLYCSEVVENFTTIINNCRKLGQLKTETKKLLDEMESKIQAKTNNEKNGQ